MKSYECPSCGREHYNERCIYCSNIYNSSITDAKIKSFIKKYEPKKTQLISKIMTFNENRTAYKYGLAILEYPISEQNVNNAIFLHLKIKKIRFIIAMLYLFYITMLFLSLALAINFNIKFGYISIITAILCFLHLYVSIFDITKKYKNELNSFKFDYTVKCLNYMSYKIKYKNEETGTISFEDANKNRHSISLYRGYNSKFR